MASVSKNQVGFGCEFVDEPPQYLQTECPICLQILREPCQVTCCGKSFCKQCIERVKENHAPCACCKQVNFNDFPNKGLQQPLYGFQVYCANKGKGCAWKGELGKLDNHLNLNPSNDKQLEGCDFAEIKCDYCSDFLTRSKLLHHKNELCDKRPFSCEHCNNYESTYEDVIHNHWPVCGHYLVQCTNKCGAFPQRQNLESHVHKECPLTVVECEFHYAGCEIRLPRKNMPDHSKASLITHLSLLAVSHKRQLKVQQEEIEAMRKKHQEEIEALEKRQQKEIKALTDKLNELSLHTQILPISFIVENPNQYILSSRWYSAPFYSHTQGYKLRLSFCTTLFSNIMSCELMQGDFDCLLKWPLKAVMKFSIGQQLEHKGHEFIHTMKLNCKEHVGGEVSAVAGRFHIDLHTYLYNNCLHIRVIGIQF